MHECMYMSGDITISKYAGDWYMSIDYVPEGEDESIKVYDEKIKFCPFCGEELEGDKHANI